MGQNSIEGMNVQVRLNSHHATSHNTRTHLTHDQAGGLHVCCVTHHPPRTIKQLREVVGRVAQRIRGACKEGGRRSGETRDHKKQQSEALHSAAGLPSAKAEKVQGKVGIVQDDKARFRKKPKAAGNMRWQVRDVCTSPSWPLTPTLPYSPPLTHTRPPRPDTHTVSLTEQPHGTTCPGRVLAHDDAHVGCRRQRV